MSRHTSDLDHLRRWLVRAVLVTIGIVLMAPLAARLVPLLLFLLAVAILAAVMRR